MSIAALVGLGCAIGSVGVAVSDRSAALHRLNAHTAHTANALRRALGRPWALSVLATTTATLLFGPVAGLLAAGAVVVGRRALRAVRASAERERAAAATAAACGVLAAELRAGRPEDAALALAAEDLAPPMAAAVRRAVVSARLGGDVPAALRAAAAEAASDAGALLLRQLAACWQVAGRTGAGLAGVVDALASDLRARERLRLETNAALAGPRTTAWLLAGLPAVGVAMAAGFGASPDRVLLRTPLGLTCLLVGIVLDLLGVLWTRRLVRRALDPR